jgi:translocation and assembly module TamA
MRLAAEAESQTNRCRWPVVVVAMLGCLSMSVGLKPVQASEGERGDLEALDESATQFAEKEGPVLTVVVEGIEGDLLQNVLALLRIAVDDGKPSPEPLRLRWLHGRAQRDIRTALEPFGYYNPSIDADLETTAEGPRAVYVVDPGEPVLLDEVDIHILGEGIEDLNFTRAVARSGLEVDSQLDHGRYETLKSQLRTIATSRGYAEAVFVEQRLLVDPSLNLADVILHFDTGPRYDFGEVTFKQDVFDEELLRRFVGFRTAKPYFNRGLLDLQSALLNSDHFASVQVVPGKPDPDTRKIPIDVYLEPRKAARYTAGIGFNTDEGPRLRLGYERRRVNRYGHRFESNLVMSDVHTTWRNQYRIPGKYPATDQYIVKLGWEHEDSDNRNFQAWTFGLDHQQTRGDWQRTIGVQYVDERFRVAGDNNHSRLLVPSIGFSRVEADNTFNVTRGWSIRLSLQGSSDAALSDVSFLQARAQGRYIERLWDRHRFIGRLQGAATWTDNFDKLPSSYRTYTGGDQSVRGYEFESIAPRDNEGETLGGRHLVVGSIEYEYILTEKWSLATFVDSGDAFNGSNASLKTGAGFGVRWSTPVGPLRVDLAHGFDEPGDDIRLHITFGPQL